MRAFRVRHDMTGANFREANLTNADFYYATLTGADFTDAESAERALATSYSETAEFTLAQLYSTASYQAHDLSGINLASNDLCRRQLRRPEPHQCEVRWCALTDARILSRSESTRSEPHQCGF